MKPSDRGVAYRASTGLELKSGAGQGKNCYLTGVEVSGSYSQKVLEKVFPKTATAGSDVVQSGRPIFDDFFQHLWPYIGNNTANVVFQMVKRLWLIRIDQ
ncbi:hypothetical protein TNCV_2104131 [Trichonephila clavipes]|nr:hypothetical protein TNCV_2104131 [Trichonephila clavipes]